MNTMRVKFSLRLTAFLAVVAIIAACNKPELPPQENEEPETPEIPVDPQEPGIKEEQGTGNESFVLIGTGLPIVVLDTPGYVPITSKETWIPDATVTIYNPDGSVDYSGTLSVKGRGNSTWTQFPKKPYAMKLDSKASILGMPKHKRWCLLANWMDRTLIRNAVAFEIARRTELAWTPSGFFVELILNGEHIGNYFLCEQIKVDKVRVNITELDADATEGEAITGGYLMECDDWFDETYKFHSGIHNVPWQFKDPDEVNEAQFDYMVDYVNRFEDALYDDDKFAAKEWLDYIEPESFADWWIVNEICRNRDVNFPKSAYIHKDKGGKLVAGPVWDFDWGTFIPQERYVYDALGEKYYLNRLFKDMSFRRLIKARWANYREALATIPEYIDALSATLVASDRINIGMWPISRETNEDNTLSYTEAVEKLKSAYIGKYNWLDENIQTY